MVQELLRVPRVFTRDEINFAEHAQRALRDVFKIANRRCDDEQRAGHETRIVTLVLNLIKPLLPLLWERDGVRGEASDKR